MEAKIKTLTVKQAIEEGYTLCGFANKDWQSLIPLEDITDEYFKDSSYNGKLVLAEKQSHSYLVDAETFRDLLADTVGENYRQECADDTDEIEELIKEVDFTEIVNTINEKISVKKWWILTNIELNP
jgi:hypothetical protein